MNDHVELQQEDVCCASASTDMNLIGQLEVNNVDVSELCPMYVIYNIIFSANLNGDVLVNLADQDNANNPRF